MVWIWKISFFPYSKTAKIDEWMLIKNAEWNSFWAEFQAQEQEVSLSIFIPLMIELREKNRRLE